MTKMKNYQKKQQSTTQKIVVDVLHAKLIFVPHANLPHITLARHVKLFGNL